MKWLAWFKRKSQRSSSVDRPDPVPGTSQEEQTKDPSSLRHTPAPTGTKRFTQQQPSGSDRKVRGILRDFTTCGVQDWKTLTLLLPGIQEVGVAIRTLHTLGQWGKDDPERLRKDLLILLSLKHWWNVLPSSPWHKVAHLLTLTLAEHLHADLRPALLPLLQSRDPLVRERAARMLKKLGWAPVRRIEMARYVVAKRNLRAVGHLANKIPRALREALPSERFLEWSKNRWVFVAADDHLPDLAFAVEALEGLPLKWLSTIHAVELLLDFCGSSQTYRERTLVLLQHVPEDSRVWKHAHVQRRLQAMHALPGVFQTAAIKALGRFEDQEGHA